MKKSIRIGNSSGFWGDDPTAMYRQVSGGHLDYITSDYLAEVSMSILQKQQDKNPERGYVEDFIHHFISSAQLIKDKNIRLITNAGGNNPLACGQRVLQELQRLNIQMTVAVIEGDHVMHLLDELYPQKESFQNFETGEDFEAVYSSIKSANAYVGLAPILEALKTDAQIIIAGRATDSAIAMAPMVYEFGWALNDWDKLGSAMIGAHIIECGSQSMGGNFTDWHLINDWGNFGFPIIEVFPDATFYVTKHTKTGGLVSVNTVKEQLVYEIADPKRYFSPDVIADLTALKITQVNENTVSVSGGKGAAPTSKLKVSMAFDAGFQAKGNIIISGGGAIDKAKKFEEIFWSRLGLEFEKKSTEYIGYNSCHKDQAEYDQMNEILLQFYAYDQDRNKLEQFSKLMASLILSGPQGVAVTGGRPRIHQIMAYWPSFIDKKELTMSVKLLDQTGQISSDQQVSLVTGFEAAEPQESNHQMTEKGERWHSEQDWITCKVKDICLARSGDKGNCVNIGVIARSEEIYLFLKNQLSAEVVKAWFASLCKGKVKRYELENLSAFNFFLEEALDGGGTRAMRIDAQGKTFASTLLNHKIKIPKELLNTILD